MASIRKIAPKKWIAEIRTKGKYLSKTHDSEAAAKAWARTEEHRLRGGNEILQGKTFGQAMTRYMEEVSPIKKGARWETIRLEKFMRDPIADVTLRDLQPVDFEQWMERQKKRELQNSSINRELNLLSSVLTKARKQWKWIDRNPVSDIERPRNPPSRDKIYTDEQVARILLALDYKSEVTTMRHKIAVAFLLSIETAMRQGEMWGLTWDNVYLEERYVHLPETKNGSSRNVPLSCKAVELLKSLPRNSNRVMDIPQASSSTIFRRTLELAEIKEMTWHDTRHTATTRMAKKLDMLTLARVTGHKDPRHLMGYFNPSVSDIARELD